MLVPSKQLTFYLDQQLVVLMLQMTRHPVLVFSLVHLLEDVQQV